MRDVQRTLQKILETAKHLSVEFGACAADFFIRETVAFLRTESSSSQDLQLDMADTTVKPLLALFGSTRIEQACQQEGTRFSRISAKVQCLLDYLLQNPSSDLCGIVFVNQRIVASVLSSLLNVHSAADGRLRCVPSVGNSSFSGWKFAITELIDRRSQKQALATFREGQANIVVATSVLEEGIDVQACNVVACFDLPANLKSYIQRRGRARHQHSRYGMLLEWNADQSKVARWRELEDQLTALCQKERQQAEVYCHIEAEDEAMDYILRVESTGTSTTFVNCFNATGTLIQVQTSFHEDQNGWIGANVTLPHSIPAYAGHASSKRTWRTEKAAKKDAAFHAYAALFKAGLLNDHLLPISQEWNINEGLGEVAPPARLQIESSDLWARSKDANDWYKLGIQIIPLASLCHNYEPLIHVVLNTYQQPSTPPTLDSGSRGPKHDIKRVTLV
ncbi:Dicer-like protein 2 [Teratosphaeriaceae sp. CCFEE 6253]|nr:Dicer-like protein 2 [Teratosphaeriaceae sp. CCFEE 6253]